MWRIHIQNWLTGSLLPVTKFPTWDQPFIAANVKNAFTFIHPEKIAGKKILLIDDICDSGVTLKENGHYLTNLGAIKITPLVIAKTVGGDMK